MQDVILDVCQTLKNNSLVPTPPKGKGRDADFARMMHRMIPTEAYICDDDLYTTHHGELVRTYSIDQDRKGQWFVWIDTAFAGGGEDVDSYEDGLQYIADHIKGIGK